MDTLFIDEISMISDIILRQADVVCRAARKSKRPFGGIQVILSGDFLQLPPVHDKFCFEWPSFYTFFPHTVILTNVYRYAFFIFR